MQSVGISSYNVFRFGKKIKVLRGEKEKKERFFFLPFIFTIS